MTIDLSPLYQTLLESAVSIATVLIAVGVYYIRSYVVSKIKNEELRNSLNLTLTTIQNAVNASVLNLKDEVKAALADGKITEEELNKIKQKAKEDVKTLIEPKLQERLQAHVSDLDKFINQAVEAEVAKLQDLTKK